ncbi:putative gustatory receptor 28b [Microplitis mediator]|uniref:putative gustatory receptor 28b n=1 Tax=Microplitis mediator TaxID=375433 RepID=UPI0025531C75|nr:putative gustatory receptor 28b [Microplitis mediator]
MKIRFESVNKVLSEIFKLQTNNSAHKIETDYKWAISRRVEFDKDFTKILNNIKRIHLELGTLCHELTKIFGIPIILTIISAFANITSLCVIMYRDIKDPEIPSNEKIGIAAILSIWLIIFTCKFVIVNYICAVTLFEWEKTGEIIHKLEIESEDTEFRKEIQQFSIQILQNPLKFSPCGFIDLGFYFIRDFAGSVTSQVILIIQTYPS